MQAQELREKYLKFFESKGHTIIPSASLIPRETDGSTLFTTAGMHPLVPYLLGEEHPGGKRVASVQKCVRTGDIDNVGDNRHLTFFEMMGNWSFGGPASTDAEGKAGYFKKEAIEWSYEFLTDKNVGLGLDPKRLYVTVFKGTDEISRDEESIEIWKKVFSEKAGIEAGVAGEDETIKDGIKIIPLGEEDNFWIAGATGPCGCDTEMFYDVRPEEGKVEGKFSDLVNSGRIIEIWNNVFMEFNKKEKDEYKEEIFKLQTEGKKIPKEYYEYEKLKQTNVDTGMGLERTLYAINGKQNVFETELFQPIFEKISVILNEVKNPGRDSSPVLAVTSENEKSYHIIADHIKASVFLIAEGILPLNVGRGYVLRRLIRRAVRYGKLIGIENNFTKEIAEVVVEMYKNFYQELEKNKNKIFEELEKEENKFRKTLENPRGREALKKIFNRAIGGVDPDNLNAGTNIQNNKMRINGHELFNIYETYGLPIEISQEIMTDWGMSFDDQTMKEASEALKKHQELSRTASAGMFKGGLQDASEETTKLHTAAHLMLAALRKILGEEVFQKGSNITAERLRFDFSYPQKLSTEQIKQVEDLVNAKIQEKIPVVCEEMNLEEAKTQGAMGVFEAKYGEKVKVYSIGDFSKEICGGPHVENTRELGHFKIQKEESSSAGVRRIKAVLE